MMGTKRRTRGRTDFVVFGVAGALAVAFVLWGGLGTNSLSTVTTKMLGWLESNFGWAYVLAASGFVLFVLWLAFSRYGKIVLGRDEDTPEFKTLPWIAMMFAAGMGIGLMFYGVSEPLTHYTDPPPGTGATLDTSMATTMFHWALHPWAFYAVVGLAIAYSTFRRGRPQLVSSAFIPLIGDHAKGWIGRLIDILAIFATLFGSAASLGLSALQIGSGLKAAGFMSSVSTIVLVVVIVVLTAAFIFSAVSGIERGVQWLAATNGILGVAVALFVFIAGPTVFILNLLPTTLGDYLKDLPGMAARTEASGGLDMARWLSKNTMFYWAWWISWTPFVGMFIARISRGRTIRQFVGGVILVPSVISLVWFAIFGGAAITTQRGGLDLAARSQEGQLFGLLQQYPAVTFTSLVVMILVGVFFVSGADAASIVMGSLSQRGSTEPNKAVIAFWGALTGAVAAIMLIIGGGGESALTGLQNLTIIVASPFVIVMVLLCIALVRDLRRDRVVLRDDKGAEVIEAAVDHGTERYGEDFYLTVDSPSRKKSKRS
ncbi:BCCT family transporter [Sciscionella marina]|uniref:BCCT family transporter n=1 Tax=Sciscionella marina TaxID=508770 RepID=UPI0003A05859|nr:BCCT family transporter [Sciscionella marina]